MRKAATLFVMGLTLVGCNTLEGLRQDLGLAGDAEPQTADQQDAGDGTSGSSRPTAPEFAPGQVAMVVKPGTLRDAPSLDGNVVGYVNFGDTYYVFGEQNDWVEVGADRPVAWVFDKLITIVPRSSVPQAGTPQLSGVPPAELRSANP